MSGSGSFGDLPFGGETEEGLTLEAVVGHFVLGGKAATLRKVSKLTAEKGSFVLDGKDVTLTLGDKALAAETGHYTLFGYAAGPHGLNPDTGHFTLTGYDADLNRSYLGASDVGHFIITGYDAGSIRTRRLRGEKGSFSLSGYAAVLEIGSDKEVLMSLFQAQGAVFQLVHGQEMAAQGSGIVRGRDLRHPLWKAQITSKPFRHDDASSIEALLDALDGVIGTFYCYNPKKMYPRTDHGGTILGANIPLIHSFGADTLRLKGLPATYTISRGDFLSFEYGSPKHKALHRVVQTVTSDGSGITQSFKIRPALLEGVAVNQVVTLVRASAEMALVPDSVSVNQIDMLHDSITFEAIQVI